VHRKEKFRNRLTSARLLNATPIASGYAGRDPQIGTAIKVFSNFLLKTGLKVFLLSF